MFDDRICPACQVLLRDWATVCTKCGRKVEATEATPASGPAAPSSGRREALGAVGLGGIFLAINTHDLLRYGKYHPWMALFAPPLLFAGLVGLLYSSATLERKPAPGETGQRSSRAARSIVAAGAVGLLVGGYLVYDPGAILRWIGPK